jgi:dTDP-4-amino-4,6-dideoxygalactose transaminase
VSAAIRNIDTMAAFQRPAIARLRRYAAGWQAYRYRVPYCVPFWNRKTYLAILRAVATGRIVQGDQVARLERALAGDLAVPWARGYSRGRGALEAALAGVGVGPGDEIILPTFCCSSVVPPILAAGATPVLADIGADLNITARTIQAVLTPRTKAVLVAHLFGNPADIIAIEELARHHGIKVIDDAAQAFGATVNGRPVGTFGDAGILSFGSGKVCFGAGGGVLVSRFAEVEERSRRLECRLPRASTELKEALATLLWRRWRRNLLPVSVLLRRLRFAKAEEPMAVPRLSAREHLSNLDAGIILTLLETLGENISGRRQRARLYRDLLANVPGVVLIQHREESACLNQVIKIEPGRVGATEPADAVLARLRQHGYEVQGSYIPLHCVPEYRQFAPVVPEFADRVWPHVIELPCEPEVPLAEIERIAKIVRSSVQEPA